MSEVASQIWDRGSDWGGVFHFTYYIDIVISFAELFNVHEVLSMLEDVGEFEEASIYIEPSPVAAITDEDSDDEDEGGTYSNLN